MSVGLVRGLLWVWSASHGFTRSALPPSRIVRLIQSSLPWHSASSAAPPTPNDLKDALDLSSQRTRAIASRVAQASVKGNGFALPIDPATGQPAEGTGRTRSGDDVARRRTGALRGDREAAREDVRAVPHEHPRKVIPPPTEPMTIPPIILAVPAHRAAASRSAAADVQRSRHRVERVVRAARAHGRHRAEPRERRNDQHAAGRTVSASRRVARSNRRRDTVVRATNTGLAAPALPSIGGVPGMPLAGVMVGSTPSR